MGLKILRHSFLTSRLLCPPLNESYLSKNLENASNLGTTISDCWLIGFIRKLWRAFIYPMLLWNWGNIRIQFYLHISVAQFWKQSSYREFELSRVKWYRIWSEGEWKLLRVRGRFRVIDGSIHRESTVLSEIQLLESVLFININNPCCCIRPTTNTFN